MDRLLKWSVENSTGSTHESNTRAAPDPEILAQLFGAPDDAAMMKQAVTVATNPEATTENKVVALENLEMLVGNIDNANNLEPLKLWDPLIALLDTSDLDVRQMACWVIGTAVQNNPKGQDHFITRPHGLVRLIDLASDAESPDLVASKALYALTGAVGHSPDAIKLFENNKGWSMLRSLLESSRTKLHARVLSLINVILNSEPTASHVDSLRAASLLSPCLQVAKGSRETSPDLADRAQNLFRSLVILEYPFTKEEHAQVHEFLDATS